MTVGGYLAAADGWDTVLPSPSTRLTALGLRPPAGADLADAPPTV